MHIYHSYEEHLCIYHLYATINNIRRRFFLEVENLYCKLENMK